MEAEAEGKGIEEGDAEQKLTRARSTRSTHVRREYARRPKGARKQDPEDPEDPEQEASMYKRR